MSLRWGRITSGIGPDEPSFVVVAQNSLSTITFDDIAIAPESK